MMVLIVHGSFGGYNAGRNGKDFGDALHAG